MAYGDFKDLGRRGASHKVLRDKVFNIAKNPKYDGYQRRLASMFYRFFDKKSASFADKSATGISVANNKIKHNLQLAENYANRLLKLFKKEQLIQDSTTIFGVLI